MGILLSYVRKYPLFAATLAANNGDSCTKSNLYENKNANGFQKTGNIWSLQRQSAQHRFSKFRPYFACRCQRPESARHLLTPPPGPPAASSSAPGRHRGWGAGGGERLSWGRRTARRREEGAAPVPSRGQVSAPALLAVSCQREAGNITLEKLGKEKHVKNDNKSPRGKDTLSASCQILWLFTLEIVWILALLMRLVIKRSNIPFANV